METSDEIFAGDLGFLRAWGSFIFTSAVGISRLFPSPGLAPTAMEVAGSLALYMLAVISVTVTPLMQSVLHNVP